MYERRGDHLGGIPCSGGSGTDCGPDFDEAGQRPETGAALQPRGLHGRAGRPDSRGIERGLIDRPDEENPAVACRVLSRTGPVDKDEI